MLFSAAHEPNAGIEKMPSKTQFVVAAMALAVIFLASLLLPASSDAASQRPIRIGFPPWIGYDIILHAQESGLFEKHGLEVELIRFDETSDVARAVINGRLDAGFTGLATLIANHKGVPLEVVLFTNISNGADGIVARPGIHTVADLKGKRIGCKIRATNLLILVEALEHHGLSLSDVQIFDVSNDAAERMLEQGALDAAVIWDPELSAIADRIGGDVIHRTSNLNSAALDTLTVRAADPAASPQTIAALRAVWFELLEEIEQRPEAVFETVSLKLAVPIERVASSWTGITPGDPQLNHALLGESFENTLQRVARMMGEPESREIRPAPFSGQPEAHR